ncbi:hypothetical protein [Ottowia thiooxydans]|uniref:hypothetical protein n=1 Tax=Ottowia thiooxydans TaxID=219182 RepID=UPI00068908F1|nr:hypothetical protein [Ottowia thiooxydans]
METKQLLEAVQVLQVVQTLFEKPQNQWLPVIAAIGGAFAGGFATLVPSYVLEERRRRHERTTVSNALLAEVRAIMAIVKQRKYVETFHEISDTLKQSPEKKFQLRAQIPDHYSRVYQAHVERLGVLEPSFAAKIIEFHQLLESVVQDIAPGGLIAEEGGNLESYAQLVSLSNAAVELGDELSASEARGFRLT